MKAVKKLCQATLALVLTISLVFSTGIKGVFADVTTATQKQTDFITSLTTNMDSYENALNLLSGAQELDSQDETTINNYIDTLVSSSELTDADKSDLNLLKNDLLPKGRALATEYADLVQNGNTDEINQYSQQLQTALRNLSTNKDITELGSFLANISNIIPDVGLGEAKDSVSSTDLVELKVQGLDLIAHPSDTVYVGYEVTDVEISALSSSVAKVEIIKPEQLVVGNNEVRIIVTTLNGAVKEYIVNVVRLEQYEAQGDGTDEQVSNTTSTPQVEPMVSVPEEKDATYVSKSYSEEKTADEKENKKEVKKEKEYDEEVEEDKGLNGLTVLLIVAGIALIGFGIYMLFGDKDDEIPTVKTKKTTNINSKPNNNTNGKKTNNTKKKR